MELHGPSGFTTITNDNWRSTQAAEIQDKLKRLHFKSMGAILLLQEQIRQQHLTSAQPTEELNSN